MSAHPEAAPDIPLQQEFEDLGMDLMNQSELDIAESARVLRFSDVTNPPSLLTDMVEGEGVACSDTPPLDPLCATSEAPEGSVVDAVMAPLPPPNAPAAFAPPAFPHATLASSSTGPSHLHQQVEAAPLPPPSLLSTTITAASNLPQPTPVEVYVRVRPLNTEERGRGEPSTITVVDDRTLISTAPTGTTGGARAQQYTFSRAFGEACDNDRIFKEAAEAGVEDALRKGTSYLLFSYGMTGSGKTHTMTGNNSDAGVLPRTLARVFRYVAACNEGRGEGESELVVTLSYLEVHNERVHDLFAEASTEGGGFSSSSSSSAAAAAAPAASAATSAPTATATQVGGARPSLDIVQGPAGRIHVQNARQVYVTTPTAAMALFLDAASRRTVAATAMNAHSSRSHALAFFNLYKRTPAAAAMAAAGSTSSTSSSTSSTSGRRVGGGGASLLAVVNGRTGAIESGYTPHASLVLVDLAGSERLARTGNTGVLLEQANSINKSLSHMMRCFTAMVEGSSSSGSSSNATALRGFPFRESKLTHLLWDRLQGANAGRVAMVVCVGPAASDFGETAAALRYGSLVKKIVTITDPAAARAAAASVANAVQYDIDGRRVTKGGVAPPPPNHPPPTTSAATAASQPSASAAAAAAAAATAATAAATAAAATTTAALAAATKALEEERALRKEREARCEELERVVSEWESRGAAQTNVVGELGGRVEALEEELRVERRRVMVLGEELEETVGKMEAVEEEVREEMALAAQAQLEEVEATWKAKLGRLREEEMARAERLLRLQSIHQNKGGKKRGSSMIFGLLKDAGMGGNLDATGEEMEGEGEGGGEEEEGEEEEDDDDEEDEEEGEEAGEKDATIITSSASSSSAAATAAAAATATAGEGGGGGVNDTTTFSSKVGGGASGRPTTSLSSAALSVDEVGELREQVQEAEDELERTRARLESQVEGLEARCATLAEALERASATSSAEIGALTTQCAALAARVSELQFQAADAGESVEEEERGRRVAEEEAASAKASVAALSARCAALEGQVEEERGARLSLAAARVEEVSRAVGVEREEGGRVLREVTQRLQGEVEGARAGAALARSMHDELAGAVDGYKSRIAELEKRVELFGNSITALRTGAGEKDSKIRLLSRELAEAIRGGGGASAGAGAAGGGAGSAALSAQALDLVRASQAADEVEKALKEAGEAREALGREKARCQELQASLQTATNHTTSLVQKLTEVTSALEASKVETAAAVAAAAAAAATAAAAALPPPPPPPSAAIAPPAKRRVPTRASSVHPIGGGAEEGLVGAESAAAAPPAPAPTRGGKRTRASMALQQQVQQSQVPVPVVVEGGGVRRLTTSNDITSAASRVDGEDSGVRRAPQAKQQQQQQQLIEVLEEGEDVWGMEGGERAGGGDSPIPVDREMLAAFIGSPGPLGAVKGGGGVRGATAAAKKEAAALGAASAAAAPPAPPIRGVLSPKPSGFTAPVMDGGKAMVHSSALGGENGGGAGAGVKGKRKGVRLGGK